MNLDRRPLYARTAELLTARIADGTWMPGALIPAEPEIAQELGVSPGTVRKALDALERRRLIERRQGRGTFVAQPPRTSGRLTSFTEEIRRRGMLPESQTLLARVEQAGPGVARALDISPGDPVLHWRRLRRADRAAIRAGSCARCCSSRWSSAISTASSSRS